MQGTFDGVSIKMKKDASVYVSERGIFDVCISSGPKSPLCISTESGTTKWELALTFIGKIESVSRSLLYNVKSKYFIFDVAVHF